MFFYSAVDHQLRLRSERVRGQRAQLVDVIIDDVEGDAPAA